MAFKPDRPTPFNDLAHLDADTVRFALLMREGPPNDDDEWMKGLSEEERKVIEEENKKKAKERRQKPCAVKECKQTEVAVSIQLLENIQLLRKIAEVEANIKVANEDLVGLSELQETTSRESDSLEDKLATLKHTEKKDLKEKHVYANRQKQQLDIAILKIKAELSDLKKADADEEQKDQEQSEKSKQKAHVSILPPVNFMVTHKPDPPKHTGRFEMTMSGFPMWSCCQATEEEDRGCEDDQSIGVRSALVMKPEAAFKPFTMNQREHAQTTRERREQMHHPEFGIAGPPIMNKGFRDVRASATHYQVFSKSSSLVDLGLKHPKDTNMRDGGSVASTSRSRGAMSGSMADDESEMTEIYDQGKTNLVYLESSKVKADKKMQKLQETRSPIRKPNRVDRPYNNDTTGSMRLSSKAVTSGPFTQSLTVDLTTTLTFGKDKGMPRSDISNKRIRTGQQSLDSASLLAAYNSTVNGSFVGQQRHKGMKDMRRLGGRPLQAKEGAHLRTTSTVGRSTSLTNF